MLDLQTIVVDAFTQMNETGIMLFAVVLAVLAVSSFSLYYIRKVRKMMIGNLAEMNPRNESDEQEIEEEFSEDSEPLTAPAPKRRSAQAVAAAKTIPVVFPKASEINWG